MVIKKDYHIENAHLDIKLKINPLYVGSEERIFA